MHCNRIIRKMAEFSSARGVFSVFFRAIFGGLVKLNIHSLSFDRFIGERFTGVFPLKRVFFWHLNCDTSIFPHLQPWYSSENLFVVSFLVG